MAAGICRRRLRASSRAFCRSRKYREEFSWHSFSMCRRSMAYSSALREQNALTVWRSENRTSESPKLSPRFSAYMGSTFTRDRMPSRALSRPPAVLGSTSRSFSFMMTTSPDMRKYMNSAGVCCMYTNSPPFTLTRFMNHRKSAVSSSDISGSWKRPTVAATSHRMCRMTSRRSAGGSWGRTSYVSCSLELASSTQFFKPTLRAQGGLTRWMSRSTAAVRSACTLVTLAMRSLMVRMSATMTPAPTTPSNMYAMDMSSSLGVSAATSPYPTEVRVEMVQYRDVTYRSAAGEDSMSARAIQEARPASISRSPTKCHSPAPMWMTSADTQKSRRRGFHMGEMARECCSHMTASRIVREAAILKMRKARRRRKVREMRASLANFVPSPPWSTPKSHSA